MSEMQHLVCLEDKVLHFNGRVLHKKAFLGRATHQPEHAAVVAGVALGALRDESLNHILPRMVSLRNGFRTRMQHFMQTWWLETALKLKMVTSCTGLPVTTYSEMVDELASNPRMENFQNWYRICYHDTEVHTSGRSGAESKFMDALGIQYPDKTNSGGCVGELMAEVTGKMMETIQKKAKDTMNLYLVKSKPGKAKVDAHGRTIPNRRKCGDYYIVRYLTGKGGEWWYYNVSQTKRLDPVVQYEEVSHHIVLDAIDFLFSYCLLPEQVAGGKPKRKDCDQGVQREVLE